MSDLSKKVFTLEEMGGRPMLKRVPVPEDALKYDPNLHFHKHEESDYLNVALKGVPYGTYKTDEEEKIIAILREGYLDKDTDIMWRSLFSYWSDQHHAILVPAYSAPLTLADIGIKTVMKGFADSPKVAKYAKRMLQAHGKEQTDPSTGAIIQPAKTRWGKCTGWAEGALTGVIQLDRRPQDKDLTDEDLQLIYRFVDLKKLNDLQIALGDGAGVLSNKAVRRLDLSQNPKLGMAWGAEASFEEGFGKGNFVYLEDMEGADIVIYGAKSVLRTDTFFFGTSGPLHAGVAHTDMQAVVNFGFHRPGLMVPLSRKFMAEVLEFSGNEDDMRSLFFYHTKDETEETMTRNKWVLLEAMRFDISHMRFPAEYRKIVRHFNRVVLACDQDARIPMSSVTYSVAKRAYVLMDPKVIIRDGDYPGDIDPSRGIPDGCIIFPDLPSGTEVVVYRQPSGHSNEHYFLTVVQSEEYRQYRGRGICMLGQGADKVLKRLGGGDLDDSFIIVHDPVWVAAFHSLRKYPETEKINIKVTEAEQLELDKAAEAAKQYEEERFAGVELADPTVYSRAHEEWQIQMAKKARAGIGPVVNFGMIDLLLSDPDHMASMLADLLGVHDENADESAKWLQDRPKYEARRYMTNLESIIDGIIKDRTLLDKLNDADETIADRIKRFHMECRVYPDCCVGRIPLYKADAPVKDYRLARTEICRALDRIRAIRKSLEAVFVRIEWTLVDVADKAIRNTPAAAYYDWAQSYPENKEYYYKAVGQFRPNPKADPNDRSTWFINLRPNTRSLRDIWSQEWKREREIPGNPRLSDGRANKDITAMIAAEVEGLSDDQMEALAVELYFGTYRRREMEPPVDPQTGMLRSFPDGLLWSSVFAMHFINALRKSGLAGFHIAVNLRHEYANRLRDKAEMVMVKDKDVFIMDSDDEYTMHIGTISRKISGKPHTYRMVNGIIEVRRGQKIVRPAWFNDVKRGGPELSRTYPSKKDSETPADKRPRTIAKIARLIEEGLGKMGMKEGDKK